MSLAPLPTALAPPLAPPALTTTPPPGQLLRPPGFFQKRWPVGLILAAFPALAIPIAAATLFPQTPPCSGSTSGCSG